MIKISYPLVFIGKHIYRLNVSLLKLTIGNCNDVYYIYIFIVSVFKVVPSYTEINIVP